MKLIQCCFLNLSYVLDSRKNLLWKRHNKITSTRKVLLQHTDSNSFLNLPFPSFPQSSLFCCLGVLWAWALHRFPGALHRSPPKASLMSSLQHFSICMWLFDGNLSPTKCNFYQGRLVLPLSYLWGPLRCSGAHRGWGKPDTFLWQSKHKVSM